MKNSLLFRPLPFKDETPASILIRAAQENGHSSVYQLLSGTDVLFCEERLRATLVDPIQFALLIKNLGLVDEVAGLSLARVGSSPRAARQYRSAIIPNHYFRRYDARAFCAACLREQPYWRQQWLVRPFSACARHNRLLVDRCINCKRRPSLARSEISSCNHCQSSLLGMEGDTICIGAINAVEEMLDYKDFASLNLVLEFWGALARFDGLMDDPSVDYARLEAAVSFLRGDGAALEYVAAQAVYRLPSMRLSNQLLPFLSGGPMLKNFADEVASAVWPFTEIGAAKSRLPYLSKSEVCALLKLPPAKLIELLTRGDINFLSDGQQKIISAIERDLRMEGFSQTEILYMYYEDT
ncbi:TniQ family protein [Oxalobacteraceae sp. CFBP 8761]|nr:TniQ family protein [Oxalobacteraceae sp. CFBP 8761]